MIVVGTSGLVRPAADIPDMAVKKGIPVVEINPKPNLAKATWQLASESVQVLTAIADAIQKRR